MSCVVVCIILDDVMFGGGLYPPLYSLGGQGYMEVLAKYELSSLTRVLLG
jgi:hypothetical protein